MRGEPQDLGKFFSFLKPYSIINQIAIPRLLVWGSNVFLIWAPNRLSSFQTRTVDDIGCGNPCLKTSMKFSDRREMSNLFRTYARRDHNQQPRAQVEEAYLMIDCQNLGGGAHQYLFWVWSLRFWGSKNKWWPGRSFVRKNFCPVYIVKSLKRFRFGNSSENSISGDKAFWSG